MSLKGDDRYNLDSQPDRNDSWLSLEIYVKANHPELLNGLDRWLELGLISHAQVIKICRQNLSCTLPELKTIVAPKIDSAKEDLSKEKALVKVASHPSVVSRVWQGFLDELSIRWLLFLGIFLVVVSSGVLAASQWNNFPIFGQYLILLVYTLGFWGIGLWSSSQENLKLTSQTLSAIAILLIPINFWAINHFGLGNSILEWITLIVSLIILSSIVYGQSKIRLKYKNRLFAALFLLLSYLHLVWQFLPSPLIALYSGIITISVIHYLFLLPKQKYPVFNLLFLLATWSLILVRVILSKDFLILDCASAIALFGWILASIYLTKERQALNNSLNEQSEAEQLTNAFLSKVLQIVSIIIFISMWSISLLGGIFESPFFFWQTVGISVLAIHLFSQRLTLYWRKRDITAIFIIGLQTVFIAKELIPNSLRSSALNLAINISKTEYLPESVFGVTLFPYVVLFVVIASWLYRRQKIELARYTESLTLLLGIGLTYLSLSNPTWRSLNLLFSTVTLGYVACIRQPIRIALIQFAHLLGLITIVNGIDVIFPNLSQPVWGAILVLLMAIEWLIYSRQTRQSQGIQSIFIKSCWYVGLLLAAISYVCLASYLIDRNSFAPTVFAWGLLWFITPGMLIWLAKNTYSYDLKRAATTLSCISLIVAQIPLIEQPIIRSLGLITAVGLMYGNAFHLRRTWVTAIHLGFGLSLLISVLDNFVSNTNWLIVAGAFILGLYQFRLYLKEIVETPKFSYISQRSAFGIFGVGIENKNYKLIYRYIKAADYWAIALAIIATSILSVAYADIAEFNSYPQYLITTILIIGAVIWRYRNELNNLVLYSLVWLTELLTIGLVAFLGGSNFSFAVTNIVLGLFTWVIVGQISKASSSSPLAKLNTTYIPLIYTALAIFWRLSLYNIYTGLITLGAAFILINTSPKDRQINRTTNYLGFIGISLGVYEIVIYKMQQSSGGSIADGLTILALVAAAIAFCYRLGAWWYRRHQHKTIFNLSLSRVILVAHIHWAMSSILKIIAASIAIETTSRLTPISIATSFCLGAYAVIQGKDRDRENTNSNNDWWVYVGLVEIVATLVYSRLIINRLSFFDPWRVILTCAIALLIYQIPWHNFGWRVTPWQRTALVTPALMALVTAEDISYFSLFITAIFYIRIAYHQKNLRWSYISLGFINWGIIRLVWQFNTEFIWLAGIMSLSILYIAQFDPYFISQHKQRHFIRLVGCSILCIAALFYQDPGIIPGVISFSLIFLGLGLRIRAFLFSGTITLILTVIYQLITLIVAYAFLKWVVGLLAGIFSIVIAAGFEKNRDRFQNKLHNYNKKLQDWQ